jgi:group I intron endonuclease
MSGIKFLIYKFTSPSGKSYIGQTKNLKRRIQAHKTKNRCLAFHSAIQKYGFENFTFEILYENLTLDEANHWEVIYIKEHGTLFPNGYNLATGGSNSILCKESRAKIADKQRGQKRPTVAAKTIAIHTGRKASEETKAKMSASQKGRKHTPETILKMSTAQKGLKKPPVTDETRLKLSKSKKGVPKSAEHREKLSEAAKKRAPVSDETRAKISAAAKNRAPRPPVSEETRKKMSAAVKNRPPRPPASDETREKLKLARNNQSAETRAKNSESQRKRHAKNREEKAALLTAKPPLVKINKSSG